MGRQPIETTLVAAPDSDQVQLGDRVALLAELVHRRLDLPLGELVHLEPLRRSTTRRSETVHGKLEMSPSSTP